MTLDAHFHRGQEAYDREQWPEAAFHFEMARKVAPDDALLLAQLGSALRRSGRIEASVEVQEALVALNPGAPEALSNLAATYLAIGKLDVAERRFEKALSLRPEDPELQYNLATAKQWRGKPAEAVRILKEVVRAIPHHHRAWSNLGICLKALGNFDAARHAQEQAVKLSPTDPNLQWNLALTELLQGDLAKGFERYEWRRRLPWFPKVGGTPWRGEPLESASLVVFAEQGLGDALQFIRYLPEVKKRVSHVTLMCRPTMITLMKESFTGVDDIIPMGTVEPTTQVAPLMSLPHLLRTVSPRRSAVPYLHPSPERFALWSKILFSDGRLRVGLCWQGNPLHKDDATRSIPLEHLAAILHHREVRFFSLQKFDGVDQLRALPPSVDIVELGAALDEKDAFVDTAAVISCLDIVITVDTAIAHLAGALGCETWTLLPFVSDFRWGLGGATYYPTMRLFRQSQPGRWSDVVDAMEAALLEAVRPARCLV